MKKIELWIWSGSGTAMIALLALAVYVEMRHIILGPFKYLDLIIFAIIVILAPYGAYYTLQQRKIKKIEERLPDFLRDVAEAGRFGMILSDAIIVASTGRYGLLTPEIRKMAGQIQLGVPVNDALKEFRDHLNTPLVNRTTSIIIKANEAGGNVADVLTMVAHAAKEEQLVAKERVIEMQTYTFVMFIAFGVFLATIIILTYSFLPEMLIAGRSLAQGLKNMPLGGGFQGIAYKFIPQIELLLVISALISAIGDGILAGVLKDGKYASGMLLAAGLLAAGYIVFKLIGMI